MAEPLRPAPAKTYGRDNWVFVPTTAGYATGVGPTVAEVSGASALDFTRIAFADSAPAPTQNTNLVDQNRRFGDTTLQQFVGTTTYQGGEMKYSYDPQAASGTSAVKLWEILLNTTGTVSGFLVRRQNLPRSTAFAAGQFVDVYPVEVGPSMPTNDGQDETSEAAAMCSYAITSQPLFKVAVLA